jgi:hypothetical protein
MSNFEEIYSLGESRKDNKDKLPRLIPDLLCSLGVQTEVRVKIPAPEGMCVNPALKARSSKAQGEGCSAAATLG